MPDVREKLVELLGNLFCGDYGINGCDSCKYNTEVMCSAYACADHLIRGGATIQRWIPVTERLPRKEEYTAKADDGTEYYVRLLIAYKTDIIEYEIGYYDGYKWMTEMPIRLIKDVVAWMPLHELPKGDD